MEWSESRFAVVARERDGDAGVRLATSGPLPWPPSDAKALQDVTRAAERLESSLLTAGWTPLPPGRAWYAKRFAWAGDAPRLAQAPAPVPEPVAALPRADAARASGRFTRSAKWPPGSEALWRCEIKWHSGYVNSCFEAAAHGPDRRRGITLARSDRHKWLLKGDPEKWNTLYTAQVRRLADRLVAAGWSPAGRGQHWYQLRFVWRHASPPDRLEPAAAEAER